MTSLDLANLCTQRISRLKTTCDAVAALTGIPTTSARNLLQGIRQDTASLKRLSDTITLMERLYEATRPLPLDMKNVAMLKPLLEDFVSGDLRIDV